MITPIKYIQIQNIFTFIYSKEDYNKWNDRGKEFGDSGPLLLSIDYDNEHVSYLSYGTIENPIYHRYTMTLAHLDMFDGKLPTPDEVLNPVKGEDKTISCRMEFIDMSNTNPNLN